MMGKRTKWRIPYRTSVNSRYRILPDDVSKKGVAEQQPPVEGGGGGLHLTTYSRSITNRLDPVQKNMGTVAHNENPHPWTGKTKPVGKYVWRLCCTVKKLKKTFLQQIMRCCGSGMFIPDPNFSIPGLVSRAKKIPDPHWRISVFLTIKLFLSSLGNMIRDTYGTHPGSGSRILIYYPYRIPDPGVKKASDPGSGTLKSCR